MLVEVTLKECDSLFYVARLCLGNIIFVAKLSDLPSYKRLALADSANAKGFPLVLTPFSASVLFLLIS